MKSFLKIYVVLSTGFVLSTAQNYQEPPIKPQPRNHPQPLHQQQQHNQPPPRIQHRSPIHPQTLKTAPTYPSSERNNHQPLKNIEVPSNFNNAKHPPHDYNHLHVIRKITIPIADVNNDEESHVIYLPVNGDPKDVKIVHFGSDLEEPYDDSEMSEAVKEVVAKALAVNRGEAKIIHEYNAQSTNQFIPTFITSNDAKIPLSKQHDKGSGSNNPLNILSSSHKSHKTSSNQENNSTHKPPKPIIIKRDDTAVVIDGKPIGIGNSGATVLYEDDKTIDKPDISVLPPYNAKPTTIVESMPIFEKRTHNYVLDTLQPVRPDGNYSAKTSYNLKNLIPSSIDAPTEAIIVIPTALEKHTAYVNPVNGNYSDTPYPTNPNDAFLKQGGADKSSEPNESGRPDESQTGDNEPTTVTEKQKVLDDIPVTPKQTKPTYNDSPVTPDSIKEPPVIRHTYQAQPVPITIDKDYDADDDNDSYENEYSEPVKLNKLEERSDQSADDSLVASGQVQNTLATGSVYTSTAPVWHTPSPENEKQRMYHSANPDENDKTVITLEPTIVPMTDDKYSTENATLVDEVLIPARTNSIVRVDALDAFLQDVPVQGDCTRQPLQPDLKGPLKLPREQIEPIGEAVKTDEPAIVNSPVAQDQAKHTSTTDQKFTMIPVNKPPITKVPIYRPRPKVGTPYFKLELSKPDENDYSVKIDNVENPKQDKKSETADPVPSIDDEYLSNDETIIPKSEDGSDDSTATITHTIETILTPDSLRDNVYHSELDEPVKTRTGDDETVATLQDQAKSEPEIDPVLTSVSVYECNEDPIHKPKEENSLSSTYPAVIADVTIALEPYDSVSKREKTTDDYDKHSHPFNPDPNSSCNDSASDESFEGSNSDESPAQDNTKPKALAADMEADSDTSDANYDIAVTEMTTETAPDKTEKAATDETTKNSANSIPENANTDKPSENLVTEATTDNAATDDTTENAATDKDESTETKVEDTVIETTAENEEIKTITENKEDKIPVNDTTNCNLHEEKFKSHRTLNKITFEDIKQVISSEDATTSKDEPLDTVTFLVSLVRTAFQGSDSLKELFQDPRVQEFVQHFY